MGLSHDDCPACRFAVSRKATIFVRMSGVLGRALFGTFALTLTAGCMHLPMRAQQDFRRQQFFATHREISPSVANAINAGHVILDMDREEVWVVLGDPVWKSMFRAGAVEVWLYPAVRLHQDVMHSRGAVTFRLVFIDGRLRVIEPL